MWPFHKHQWKEISRLEGITMKDAECTLITFQCGESHYKQQTLRGHIKEATNGNH